MLGWIGERISGWRTAASSIRWKPGTCWRLCSCCVRPRWLFAPYWVDAHPDHIAATELVDAARFWSKLTKTDMPGEPHHPERIYNYYCVHLKMAAQPAFILDISDEWEQKLAAIRATKANSSRADRPIRPCSSTRCATKPRTGAKRSACDMASRSSREPIGFNGMEEVV